MTGFWEASHPLGCPPWGCLGRGGRRGTVIPPARPSARPRCVQAGPPGSTHHAEPVMICKSAPQCVSVSATQKLRADEPPAGAEFWSRALAACGRFPAVAPDTVSAALPHCDWSSFRLLFCSTGNTASQELE